jgi:hypothetical protein
MPKNVPKPQSEYARIASQFAAAKKLQDAEPRPQRSRSLDAAVQRRRERDFKVKHGWLMAWLGVIMSASRSTNEKEKANVEIGRCISSASTYSQTASSSPASS